MNDEIKRQALGICEILYNKKAIDIVAIHVTDKTILADWFVICSGRAVQQVKALAEERGWNPNNASIEFYQWRKFNGIRGRQ